MSEQPEDFFLSREVFETLEFRYKHPEIEDEEYTSIQKEHIETFKSVVEKIFNYFVIYTEKIFSKYYGFKIKIHRYSISNPQDNFLFIIKITSEDCDNSLGRISMKRDYNIHQRLELNVGIETTNKYKNFSKIRNRFSPLKSEFKAVSELTKIAENYNDIFGWTEVYQYWLQDEISVSFDLWCDRLIWISKFINDATDKINKIIPSILVI